jgi:hypothetical protein
MHVFVQYFVQLDTSLESTYRRHFDPSERVCVRVELRRCVRAEQKAHSRHLEHLLLQVAPSVENGSGCRVGNPRCSKLRFAKKHEVAVAGCWTPAAIGRDGSREDFTAWRGEREHAQSLPKPPEPVERDVVGGEQRSSPSPHPGWEQRRCSAD